MTSLVFRWQWLLALLLPIPLASAGLEFPAVLKEIHAPADAETVTADFPFHNRTDRKVTIKSYESTCSCIAAEVSGGKLTYAPGESGVMRATFRMENFSGTVDKTIPLWLDNDPEGSPSVTLTVRVHIPVLIKTEPKTVQWSLGAEAAPQTIRIRIDQPEPIRVTSATTSSPAFTLNLNTIEEGRAYDLVVAPKSTDTQGIAVIRLETDCKVEKQRIQQVFAVVRKPTPQESRR